MYTKLLGIAILMLFFISCKKDAAPKIAETDWDPPLDTADYPFKNELKKFKDLDNVNPPKPHSILFIGSSSIKDWNDLDERFPSYPIIRRGLGGSYLYDWANNNDYQANMIFRYKPIKIFVYAGENDVDYGRSPQQVKDHFNTFYTKVHASLPNTPIYFMSLKVSVNRIAIKERVLETNRSIKELIRSKPLAYYIDVTTPLFKPGSTEPDSSLFKADYKRLNKKGYDKWEVAIRPYVTL